MKQLTMRVIILHLAGNVLTAVGGGATHSGIWSVTDSNSNDDSLNDLDFIITFFHHLLFCKICQTIGILFQELIQKLN